MQISLGGPADSPLEEPGEHRVLEVPHLPERIDVAHRPQLAVDDLLIAGVGVSDDVLVGQLNRSAGGDRFDAGGRVADAVGGIDAPVTDAVELDKRVLVREILRSIEAAAAVERDHIVVTTGEPRPFAGLIQRRALWVAALLDARGLEEPAEGKDCDRHQQADPHRRENSVPAHLRVPAERTPDQIGCATDCRVGPRRDHPLAGRQSRRRVKGGRRVNGGPAAGFRQFPRDQLVALVRTAHPGEPTGAEDSDRSRGGAEAATAPATDPGGPTGQDRLGDARIARQGG